MGAKRLPGRHHSKPLWHLNACPRLSFAGIWVALALTCCVAAVAGCSGASETTTPAGTTAAAGTSTSTGAPTYASTSVPPTTAVQPPVNLDGATWELVSADIAGNFVDMPPQLSADPAAPTTLFVATSAGLLASTDGGSSWVTVLAPPVTSILAAPSSPSVLYASTPQGIRRSEDRGDTWGPAGATGLPAERAWVDLKLVAQSGTVFVQVWCDGDGSGVYRSEDRGRTWALVPGLPERPVPAAMAEIPGKEPLLLVAAYSATATAETAPKGVFASVDDGQTWALPGGGWAWSYIPDVLAVDPHHASTILGAIVFEGHEGLGAMVRTTDRGQTWQEVAAKDLPSAPRQLLFDARIPHLLYSCNPGVEDIDEDSPVHCSLDGGTTWRDISKGLPAESWPAIFGNPAPEGGIYAVTHNGLYKWVPAGT